METSKRTYAKYLSLDKFPDLGMNPNSDRYILPDQYLLQPEPNYKGDGMHSVAELQKICREYQEYCHQQAIIKQVLIDTIKP